MSHTVTVTRTTTTATTSAILLNVGYFKKPIGILKLLHVLLGIVVVGITGNYISYYYEQRYTNIFVPELFLLLIATTCLIASTILLFSCFVSIATATILPKTIFELLFHGFATIFLLISSAVYIARVSDYSNSRWYTARMAAGVLGLINAVLYGAATFLSYKAYKTG